MFSLNLRHVDMQHLRALSLVVIVALQSCTSGVLSTSDIIRESCQRGLDFTSIAEFVQFINEFKAVSVEQLRLDKISDDCITDRESILELEKIIETRYVCDYAKVEEIIAYHQKHLKSKRFSRSSRSITSKFFTRYAIQVAYTCKKNLLRNLAISKDELRDMSKVFEEARDRIYKEEPSIKSNIRLIEEQPSEPATANVQPKDQAEMTLSEYREALTKLRRPEDILTFDRNDCRNNKQRETTISKDKLQIFFKPSILCLQLSRYYAGSVLSIARLANYGYMAVDEELDLMLSDSPLVKDWIIAVQVCDPLLYMSTSRIEGEWAIIDTCAERVASIEMMVFEDHLEELDNSTLEEMLPKSEATRHQAQRVMKSAMKKMAKANIIHQLSSGVKKRSIFSKSLAMIGKPPGGSLFRPNSKHSKLGHSGILTGSHGTSEIKATDKESYELLMKIASGGPTLDPRDMDGTESAVSAFDPMSSLVSALTVIAIMLCFEWLFFIVMTLAARICHSLHFNFDNILTFPPKVLRWSDADFAKFNAHLETLDEDDLFDYDELTPDEQQQRDMLAQVFGRPPPLLFKE